MPWQHNLETPRFGIRLVILRCHCHCQSSAACDTDESRGTVLQTSTSNLSFEDFTIDGYEVSLQPSSSHTCTWEILCLQILLTSQ
uniref:Uncharacterized protein n=1 Tax=Rhizophora mucronata TaxID=61149 RepID=A0A2P2LIJ9_RHIMU